MLVREVTEEPVLAIRVRCPRCWETAEVSEDALGKSGKCNRCGARVQIPAKLAKACFLCGVDVTHVKHAKDEENNYICMDCWEERNPIQKALFAVPDVECSLCHATFHEGEGFERAGEPVCRDCFKRVGSGGLELTPRVFDEDDHHLDLRPPAIVMAEREMKRDMERAERAAITAEMPLPPPSSSKKGEDDEPYAHKWEPLSAVADREFSRPGDQKVAEALTEAAGQARRAPVVVRRGGLGTTVLALAALALAGYAAWEQYRGRPTWEGENRVMIQVLKAQGDLLAQVGRPEEAAAKYDELLRLVDKRPLADVSSRQAVADAQRARQHLDGRDDWEERNAMRLLIMKGQAEVLAIVGKYDDALAKYGELQAAVKGRPITGPLLLAELQKVSGEMRLVRQEKALATAQATAPAVVTAPTTQPVTPEPVAVRMPEPVRTPEPARTAPAVGPVKTTPDPPVTPDPGPAAPRPTTRKSIFDD